MSTTLASVSNESRHQNHFHLFPFLNQPSITHCVGLHPYLGTVRYSDVSFLRTVFIPNVLFRKVFIPKGRFSELFLVLWSERLIIRKVIAPKILIPKFHFSERFLIRNVFIPNGFYPERFLIRTVLIPKGRFSEIRNKNLSDQKPFGSKIFMMSKKFS